MVTVRRVTWCGLALAVLAGGCGGSLAGPCEDGSCGTQRSSKQAFQVSINLKLDLLFVIDDTSPIAPHLDALATGLADSAQTLLDAHPEISLHVGFTRAGTCDSGARGAACGIANGEQFVRSEWCNTITNYNFAGSFGDAFTCLADFGAGGCGPAQPLAAAVRALAQPPRPGWEGFLRPEAYLMIVIIAAADDASGPAGSPTPAASFAATLKALKPDPGQVLASLFGPADCAAPAQAAPRLVEFIQQFGGNGVLVPLCGGQLPLTLTQVTSPVSIDLAPPCMGEVRDTDLGKPGLQAECVVERRLALPEGGFTTAALPSCDDASPPCWRLIPSPASYCRGYLATIDQGVDWCEEAASNVTIECLGCADADDPACASAP
jgi:hypothetical protein